MSFDSKCGHWEQECNCDDLSFTQMLNDNLNSIKAYRHRIRTVPGRSKPIENVPVPETVPQVHEVEEGDPNPVVSTLSKIAATTQMKVKGQRVQTAYPLFVVQLRAKTFQFYEKNVNKCLIDSWPLDSCSIQIPPEIEEPGDSNLQRRPQYPAHINSTDGSVVLLLFTRREQRQQWCNLAREQIAKRKVALVEDIQSKTPFLHTDSKSDKRVLLQALTRIMIKVNGQITVDRPDEEVLLLKEQLVTTSLSGTIMLESCTIQRISSNCLLLNQHHCSSSFELEFDSDHSCAEWYKQLKQCIQKCKLDLVNKMMELPSTLNIAA